MLTHVDVEGKAKMVDITQKGTTNRVAFAGGWIYIGKKILQLIKENNMKKGDVLNTAKIAGILAAKKTGELIPLCHPLNITYVNIKFQFDEEDGKIFIFSEAKINAPTGVEMEALTAVNICALTIYDMCKGVDKKLYIGESYLIKKTGGKSGTFVYKDKIRGKIKNIDNNKVEIIGFLPEHLEKENIFLLNNKEEIKIIIKNFQFFLEKTYTIKKGDLICLR